MQPLSPTAKIMAPHVEEVIKTAQKTIDASLACRKQNVKFITKTRQAINQAILMLGSSDKHVQEKLQVALQFLNRVR